VSAWLARRGARVVGIDNSAAQLATARRLQVEHGHRFPLLHGNAERIDPDASFDFAISEYGACLWADPHRWVPEAARLLRPGGRLAFLVNSRSSSSARRRRKTGARRRSAAAARVWAVSDRVARRPEGRVPPLARRLDSAAAPVRIRDRGSDRGSALPTATTRYPIVTLEWARQWPCEEVWKVRKR
jgi:SAM-dependent methyltransferase